MPAFPPPGRPARRVLTGRPLDNTVGSSLSDGDFWAESSLHENSKPRRSRAACLCRPLDCLGRHRQRARRCPDLNRKRLCGVTARSIHDPRSGHLRSDGPVEWAFPTDLFVYAQISYVVGGAHAIKRDRSVRRSSRSHPFPFAPQVHADHRRIISERRCVFQWGRDGSETDLLFQPQVSCVGVALGDGCRHRMCGPSSAARDLHPGYGPPPRTSGHHDSAAVDRHRSGPPPE